MKMNRQRIGSIFQYLLVYLYVFEYFLGWMYDASWKLGIFFFGFHFSVTVLMCRLSDVDFLEIAF